MVTRRSKILVAPVTDPGGIFLMQNTVGLIVERGSPLSHVAIVERELGLRTVVGVEGATKALEDEDFIGLNALKGQITILERSNRDQRHKDRDNVNFSQVSVS